MNKRRPYPESFREKCRARMIGNTLRRGKKMPLEAKAAISARLIGNSYRAGIPHSPEIKEQISESLKRAYAEGRHAPTDTAVSIANLSGFQAAVKAGTRKVVGWKSSVTHCPQGHAYEGNNVRIGRDGYRVCRTCANESCRKCYHDRQQRKRERALHALNVL